MPIYDQGYRRYEARAPLRAVRFWPIMREALRLILAKRAFIGLIVVSWIALVVRAVQVYVVTQFPQAGRVLRGDHRQREYRQDQRLPFPYYPPVIEKVDFVVAHGNMFREF